MSWVTANGIALDPYLALNKLVREPDRLVGEQRRAFNGGARHDVAARKRGWTGETVPVTQEVAEAIRGLLEGSGDSWSFDTDLWSSKGQLGVATAAAVGAAAAKYGGAGLDFSGAGSLVLPVGGSAWTLVLWRQYDAGIGLEHWIIKSDTTRFVAGVSSSMAIAWVTVGATQTTLTADSATYAFDDLLFLPFSLPATWAPQIYTAHALASLVPGHKLRLTGDFFGGEVISARGELLGTRSIKTAGGIRQVLSFRLEEI